MPSGNRGELNREKELGDANSLGLKPSETLYLARILFLIMKQTKID